MPALDLSALKKDIDARRLRPVYLFFGPDVRLVDRMVDGLESTIDEADRPFAVERMYAGEPGTAPVDIISSACVLPMLGDRRIVIVLRAEKLLKPKRTSRAAVDDDDADPASSDEPVDATAIEAYLDAPSASSTLVFVASEIDRTRRVTKRLLEKAHVVEFPGFADASGRGGPAAGVGQWVQEELLRAGKAIDADAARQLAARAGDDISKLRGDVERLLLFTEGRPRITSADIEAVVTDEARVDDWGVVNAISEGQAGRALLETGRRLDRGDSPHALVGQLRWWVSTRLAEADEARVKPALDALLRTDLALKSSGGDERVLIERLVAELTGAPLPQRGWRGR